MIPTSDPGPDGRAGSAGTVLLTGGTGFVGSHVAEALVAAGHPVRCTVRARSDTRWLDPLGVETTPLDLASGSGAPEALAGVGTVIHVAGLTRARDPGLYRRVNAEATGRLAAEAAAAGVRSFIFVSSLAARGPDGAGGPVGAYGRSKREAEERLRSAAGAMSVTVLRPPGVYGPRDTDLLPLFRMAARGWLVAPRGGAPLQPLYATDAALAVLAAAFPAGGGQGPGGGRPAPAGGSTVEANGPPEGGRPGFGPYPIAERARYGWEEVGAGLGRALGRRVRLVRLPAAVFEAAGAAAEAVARLLGRRPVFDRRRARDVARYGYTCDPAPAERALGWWAETPLEEGLARTAAWYRDAGWLR